MHLLLLQRTRVQFLVLVTDSSQLPVIPVPGNLMSPFGLHGHQVHTRHIDAYVGKTPYPLNLFLKGKKLKVILDYINNSRLA